MQIVASVASDLVPAIWRGPFDGLLPNMGVVRNGDEHLVTPADLLSSHWEAVKPPAKRKHGSDS